MEAHDFVDYYKTLGMSPASSQEDLATRFHNLAKRYHPDNSLTGCRDRFDRIVEAHNVLKDSAKRARYDALYEQVVGVRASVTTGPGLVGEDVEIQDKLLSVFYTKRRQNIREPGVAEYDLEQIFGCPVEQLEFHLWYLKSKRWIERMDTGLFAITVEGVDHVNAEHHRKTTTRLLMDRTQPDEEF